MKKFVCIALAACFVVALVSFSSSANAVIDTNITPDTVALVDSRWVLYPFSYNIGIYDFDTSLENVPTDSPYFYFLTFHYNDLNYVVPEADGRGVSLSLEIAFNVDEFGYLSSDPSDIVNSAIFTSFTANIYFSDGSQIPFNTNAFTLFDTDSGQVVDPNDADFWLSHVNSPFSLKLNGALNLSAYMGKEISSIRLYFPNGGARLRIYYRDSANYIQFSNLSTNISFVYTPTVDIIGDGFTGVNNKLDSLNSTMNTIDQDVNRVNQSVTDLKDTIEDFQQDLTSSDSSISSDISDKQDIIDSIQDAIQNDNALLDDNLNDMITGFPGAQDPFHNAPSPDGFFAVDFIQQLWSFIKAQTIFFDFIFLGLCFCLATFILRR